MGGARGGQDDQEVLEDDDPVDESHAVFGEPIIGYGDTLFDAHGPGAKVAEALPAPKGMTEAAWAAHCLTHLPYHPACPWCVACRRANTPHIGSHEVERMVPLLVADLLHTQ